MLAIGAFETSTERARAHLALILALEQRAFAALVAPAVPCLLSPEVEHHAVAFHSVDIRAAQRMVDAAALRIRLGQNDPVAGDAIDGTDMLIVAADDFHLLADLVEQSALLLSALAPAAEVA